MSLVVVSSHGRQSPSMHDLLQRIHAAQRVVPPVACPPVDHLRSQQVTEPSAVVSCTSCGDVMPAPARICRSCKSHAFQQLLHHPGAQLSRAQAQALGRIFGLPPPTLALLSSSSITYSLEILQRWASKLCDHSWRLTSGSLFSPPMFLKGRLCIWIIGKLEAPPPQLNSPRPLPSLALRDFATPDEVLYQCTQRPVLVGRPCTQCHRTRLVDAVCLHFPQEDAPLLAGTPPLLCPRIDTENVTKALAGTCYQYRGSHLLQGVVSVSQRKLYDCSVHATPPMPSVVTPSLTDEPRLQVTSPLVLNQGELAPETVQVSSSVSELVVITLNCGGAAQKSGQILSLLSELSVDIAFLQELWEGFQAAELADSPYKVYYDEVASRGAGMAILVIHSLVPQCAAQPQPRPEAKTLECYEDLQVLYISRPSGHRMILGNVYRRPKQDTHVWEVIQRKVAELPRRPGDVFIVAGDLNEVISTTSSGKVSKCLRFGNCWSFLYIPYERGEPTNFQPTGAGKVARTEIDYILIEASGPLTLLTKAVYPGVSHHGALCCVFSLPIEFSYMKNGSGKHLNFRKADPARVADLSAHLSLMLWCRTQQSRPIDQCMEEYFSLAVQFVPRYIGRVQVDESKRLRGLEYKAMLGDRCAAEQVRKWQQALRDKACRAGLGLDAQDMRRTSIDSVTSKMYKIKTKNFKVVTSVSPDGVNFPTSPREFIDEARSQAQELYGLRWLVHDVHRIRTAASRARAPPQPRDDSSMQDLTLQFLASKAVPYARQIVGAVSVASEVSPQEWQWILSKHGSEATALDELPECVLQLLAPCGHATLLRWMSLLRDGHFSRYLQSAIHICLLKKLPHWLLRNSRPIVIGPVVRRRESTLLFTKFMSRAELTGLMPPWAFAYRKELTPHHLALFLRYYLAYWALVNPSGIWCADWDESNAFCNICREMLRGYLLDDPALEHVGPWMTWFFGSFLVYLQTPFGLAPPYYMLQGGVQGDSMGVGGYLVPRMLRSWALRDEVAGPPHPCLPGVTVPEMTFSDDGRQLALSAEDMCTNLNVSADLANSSGGSVNSGKLKVYHVVLQSGRLQYAKGSLSCTLGTIEHDVSGLHTVGIPCVMHEPVHTILAAAKDQMIRVIAKIKWKKPSCILALRVVMAYAVSGVDYRLSLVPVDQCLLSPLQIQVHQAARSALSLPCWFPSKLISMPFESFGMGFPSLHLRLVLQRVYHTVLAAQSRSIYTRALVQGLLYDPVWSQLQDADPLIFQRDCERFGLFFSLRPAADLRESEIQGAWHRKDLHPPLTVVSDGAAKGQAVGFAVVIVDDLGVAGAFWGAMAVDDPSSWVAEWLGKALGVSKVLDAGYQSALLLGDNLSAAINDGLRKQTRSHYVNCIMRYLLRVFTDHSFDEGYTPSQHTTGWAHFVADAQQRAHDLASVKAARPPPLAIPLLSLLSPSALLFRHGRLCVSPVDSLSAIYETEVVPPPLRRPRDQQVSDWSQQVADLALDTNEIRACMWIRSAPYISSPPGSYCPFCELPVSAWADHFESTCLPLWVAVTTAFRSVLCHVLTDDWRVEVHSVHSATISRRGVAVPVRVSQEGCQRLDLGVIWITLSGIVSYYPRHSDDPAPVDLTKLSTIYVCSLSSSLRQGDIVAQI